jgi:hypothetical protein
LFLTQYGQDHQKNRRQEKTLEPGLFIVKNVAA